MKLFSSTKAFTNVLVYLTLVVLHITVIETANILAIFPFPGPSQYIVVQPYLKALAARDHKVTVISAFPQKNNVTNFRDIEMPEVMDYATDFMSYANVKMYKFQEILEFSWFYSSICADVLKNAKVQQLLKSKEETFDLIIVETLQTDVLYGFAEHFKAPLVGFSSYGSDPYIDALVDNISPLAYTPLATGTATEPMNFLQRLENYWHNILMFMHRIFLHNPLHNRMFREFFPNSSRSLDELRQNFSLILLNQHFSLSYPRPYVSNMIEVGGFHIQHKPQPLPQKIQEFIANSDQDVIYFSMGSNIKSEHFPATLRDKLLETFARLPYKVLWKFENPTLLLAKKPRNVLIDKWFPQGDVLANSQVKLFITHGGLLSLMESLYHGKPLLGMPIFFDQQFNMNRACKQGFALSVDYKNFNQTVFMETVIELMENPQFGQKAKELSHRFRDQPIDPLDKAIFWTEYVLRHRGASFLRSPAQYLSFWQRNSLDTAVVIVAATLSLLGFLIYVAYKLVTIALQLFGRKNNKLKLN